MTNREPARSRHRRAVRPARTTRVSIPAAVLVLGSAVTIGATVTTATLHSPIVAAMVGVMSALVFFAATLVTAALTRPQPPAAHRRP